MTVAHFEIFSPSEIKEILESVVIFFPALRHKKKPQSRRIHARNVTVTDSLLTPLLLASLT